MNFIKKVLRKNEFYLALVIILYCFVVQMKSGSFFAMTNFVNILNNITITGIFALGMLPVILTGGIDVSFAAIVALSTYVGVSLLGKLNIANGTANVLIMFAFSIVLSVLLASINGVLIGYIRLPPLVITLGMMNVTYGFLMGVLDATAQNRLPAGFNEFGTTYLLTVENEVTGRSASLPYSFLIMVVLTILTALFLRYTMLGRGIYAVGGNEKAAQKIGYDVKRIKFFAYCFMGFMASIAAVIKICNIRYNVPENLVGSEMDVIAAVVLGGTSLSGGKGSVFGTILGVYLITLVNGTLNFLGVPSYWQTFFTGTVIVVGTAITSYQAYRSSGQVADV